MKITFLGTGTSVGVPRIGCECAVCTSTDRRNKRMRCSILIEYFGRTVLVDTPPDLRTQALRYDVRSVDAVLFTHGHADHLPLARPFAEAVGAPLLAHPALSPDLVLMDGDRITGSGWTLEVMATPGHAPEHLAFALVEENALFSGDHVMGWSTSVISPPEGDMDAYLDSLDRALAAGFDTLWPTHGGPVTDPLPFLKAIKAHRLGRDEQVLKALAKGPSSALAMVPALYAAVDERLWPAAAQSLLAHLIRLERRGEVTTSEPPSATTVYQLAG